MRRSSRVFGRLGARFLFAGRARPTLLARRLLAHSSSRKLLWTANAVMMPMVGFGAWQGLKSSRTQFLCDTIAEVPRTNDVVIYDASRPTVWEKIKNMLLIIVTFGLGYIYFVPLYEFTQYEKSIGNMRVGNTRFKFEGVFEDYWWLWLQCSVLNAATGGLYGLLGYKSRKLNAHVDSFIKVV
eukprot:TRINITY_DN103_c0_g1_i1.p1 TRINITY_DN103_c0_g1~~TRINITY_DN103_c0_g1_i1.p1  ORF type:complete len:197 (+),score=18.82 TRINITY_DN103_c0_g1_i1:45-593(+)